MHVAPNRSNKFVQAIEDGIVVMEGECWIIYINWIADVINMRDLKGI